MRKIFYGQALLAVISVSILLTGCNKENTDIPAGETSLTGSQSAEAVSETVSVSESKSYEPYQLRLYDSLGTGMPRPENYGEDMSEYYLGGELEDILSLMKDKEAAEKIRTEADSLLDLAAESYHLYSDKPPQDNIKTDCRIYNGYLFCEVNYNNIPMEYCAVFDIRTGDRLELSDMFFEGEEFLSHLNKKISEELQKLEIDNDHYSHYYIPMKREFSGLTEDGFYFNDRWFYFPVNNPYTASYTSIYVSLPDFDTVLNVPYDMSPLFEDDTEDKLFSFFRQNKFISSEDYGYSKSYETGNIKVCLFEKSELISERTAEFLAEQTENIIDTQLDRLNKKYDWIMYTDSDEPLHRSYEQDGITKTRDENYLISSGIFCNNLAYVRCEIRYSEIFEKSYNLYFDLDTLEPLSSEQLFERVYGDKKINWEPALLELTDGNWSKWDKIIEDNPPDIKSIAPENFTFKYSDGELSYYEETNDFTVFWRARAEQEEQPAGPEPVTEFKGYEPYQLKLYDSLGTGMPRPDNYKKGLVSYHLAGDLDEILSHMKDKSASKKIQDEVNEWIKHIEEKYNTDGKKEFRTYCYARNGILFYEKYAYNPYEKYIVIFDLKNGKRLELSDMFFEGEKFIDKLNKELWNNIQKLDYLDDHSSFDVDYPQMKREFAGLTEDGFYFSDDVFCFPADNPYFTTFKEINVSILNFDSVLNIPYDMTELFEDDADEHINFYTQNYDYTTSHFLQTGNIDIYLLNESPKLTEKQREFLNNKALSLTSSEFLDKMREKGWNVYSADEPPVYKIYENPDGTKERWRDIFTIDIEIINDNFAEIHFRQSNIYEAPGTDYNLHFDLETLEPIDTKQVFERTFKDEEYVWKYVTVYSYEKGNTIIDGIDGFTQGGAPDISKMKPEDISAYDLYGIYTVHYPGITFHGQIDDYYIWGTIIVSNPEN